MSIDRLSREALQKILKGDLNVDATCVIKFYSNGCHLCHALKDYYADISKEEEFDEMHFFAFNVDDYPKIEKQLNFFGVPTIVYLQVKANTPNPKIRVLPEPKNPNDNTWYTANEIKEFIKKEKN